MNNHSSQPIDRAFVGLTVAFLLIATLSSSAQAADVSPPAPVASVPFGTARWDLERLSQDVPMRWVSQDGPIHSLLYTGEPFEGQATEVFAFYASPATIGPAPADAKFPGVVLIHGGGGTAFAEWAWLWAQRGYAAIAMDLSGSRPIDPLYDAAGVPIPGQAAKQGTRTRLDNGGPAQGHPQKFDSIGGDLSDDWPYHAVASVVRAHTLLRSFPEVDADRTAVTGISWGGYTTCLVASVDTRFRAAVPVYGCGFLHEGESVQKPSIDALGDRRPQWVAAYDPSSCLVDCQVPILFVNGTNDKHYPLDSYQKSFDVVPGPKQMRVEVNMRHSHPAGWAPEEIGLFIDSYCRYGKPLPTTGEITVQADAVKLSYQSEVPLESAALHFTTDDGPRVKRSWQTVAATIQDQTVTAPLPPADANTWFLELEDERGAMVSSEIQLTSVAREDNAQRPNVLILYADDLGFGDLKLNHLNSKIPTPNLDRLASQAMRFTDGHSSSGICTPSRYALLTGRHHWRDFHGIVNAMGGSVFKPDRLTLPEMLQSVGYRTAAIGKWHLGWDWPAIHRPDAEPTKSGRNTVWGPEDFDWSKPIPDGPLAHGFDHYFGDTVINFPPYAWIEDDRLVEAPDVMMDTTKWKAIKEGRWECRPGPMVSNWDPYQNIPTTTQRGVDYLKDQANNDEPFFLYFAFPAPHAPIIPNDRFDGKSGAGPYGDFVYEVDDSIGQLLDALEQSGQADNTVVIFSADNGPEKYAYARDEKYDHWSSAPFRGLKRDIYEGGHHVPFIVRWPGKTTPGSVCDALVSQIDIMATLASALEIQLPDDAAEDSHDLLPLIEGGQTPVRQNHVHNTKTGQYALRDGDWLLIDDRNGYVSGRNQAWETKHGYPADDQAPVELYDLKQDPGQRKNLASDHPDKVTELQTRLAKIIAAGHSAPRLAAPIASSR